MKYETLLGSKVDQNFFSIHVCAIDEGSLKAICTYVIIKLSVVKHVFSYQYEVLFPVIFSILSWSSKSI